MAGLMGKKPKKPRELDPGAAATRTPMAPGVDPANSQGPGDSVASRLARTAIQKELGQVGAKGSDEVVIPLPDEDELERVRRRRAAKRAGGRSSTVLSDDDGLGG